MPTLPTAECSFNLHAQSGWICLRTANLGTCLACARMVNYRVCIEAYTGPKRTAYLSSKPCLDKLYPLVLADTAPLRSLEDTLGAGRDRAAPCGGSRNCCTSL